ncbi:bacillithiol system redox-active protein YtxJ [Flavobacterium sp. RSB2_4_14]|uniref:bacillithiol system redox-active protein YtxJ n=1 Tax=Flavobacterium sp. RSB2_4_14 TaxID=3447665 RepID=UPI003F336096
MSLFKNLFGDSNETTNSSKVAWRPLTNVGQLNEIINESTETPVVIFKHSTRCSVSRMALRQFENEFDLQSKVTPYFLDLLEHRDVSNEIAEVFQVMHQSPQLILIKNGVAIHNASHSDIAAEDLEQYV